MKVTVLAVGKVREAPARALVDDYLGRLRRYVRAEELEVKDAAALARAVPGDAVIVALEVWGKGLSSEGLARRLEAWGTTGKGHVVFLIGGAEGIPKDVSGRASFHLSLSTLTLPHRLARILLFEQLYRAMTILRGEPYAREG
ncbi:MAG: 23S rRNA (pseudouridine(1915)-N(3))-methyltransferase RlmH [Myxococcales bacterium]|nr:23S rRNA (pseudouridine(1915)-N(3))-methyltransferase RlmH [Myxococcales bacterium]